MINKKLMGILLSATLVFSSIPAFGSAQKPDQQQTDLVDMIPVSAANGAEEPEGQRSQRHKAPKRRTPPRHRIMRTILQKRRNLQRIPPIPLLRKHQPKIRILLLITESSQLPPRRKPHQR